jgi:hypothetical protein
VSGETSEFEQAVAAAVEGDLLNSPRDEIEEFLGQHLQQQLLRPAVLDSQMPAWAQGTFGPATLARRFIHFHADAICAQLCAADGSGLKPELARRLESTGARTGGLGAVAATILATLHASAPEVGGSAVAVYVAVWLLQADLQQWCRNCVAGGDPSA